MSCCRYEENPRCAFDQDRLNFAVHVRLGDRREFQDGNDEYFQLLELIMDDITAEVVQKGLLAPLFHVFSETLVPCPSGEAGLFDEFTRWPVGVDKVRDTISGCMRNGGWRPLAPIRSPCTADTINGAHEPSALELPSLCLDFPYSFFASGSVMCHNRCSFPQRHDCTIARAFAVSKPRTWFGRLGLAGR